jgi:hypothetical protein
MGYLEKLSGPPAALGWNWFSAIRDRIEETVPLNGEGIKLKQYNEGIEISVNKDWVLNLIGNLDVLELTICENGQPKTIKVLSVE